MVLFDEICYKYSLTEHIYTHSLITLFNFALFIHFIIIYTVASRAISKQVNMAAPADVVIDATNVLSKFSHIVAGNSIHFLLLFTNLLTHLLPYSFTR